MLLPQVYRTTENPFIGIFSCPLLPSAGRSPFQALTSKKVSYWYIKDTSGRYWNGEDWVVYLPKQFKTPEEAYRHARKFIFNKGGKSHTTNNKSGRAA